MKPTLGNSSPACHSTLAIIIHPLAIHNISQLINVQEQLSNEQFISESAVERLDIAILPRTARSDIQGFYADPLQTFLNSFRDKLQPIVITDISRVASFIFLLLKK
jgi:hypothetical protein